MLLFALVLCISLSSISLAWGYRIIGYQTPVVIMLLSLWLFTHLFKWRWASVPAVLLSLGLAVWGVWVNLTTGWMLSGVIFALFAYDLTEFQERIKTLPPREDIQGRTRRRLIRIAFLAVMGVLLALLFGWFRS